MSYSYFATTPFSFDFARAILCRSTLAADDEESVTSLLPDASLGPVELDLVPVDLCTFIIMDVFCSLSLIFEMEMRWAADEAYFMLRDGDACLLRWPILLPRCACRSKAFCCSWTAMLLQYFCENYMVDY